MTQRITSEHDAPSSRLTVNLDPDTKRSAVEIAAHRTLATGRPVSVSSVVRELIRDAAGRNDRPRVA